MSSAHGSTPLIRIHDEDDVAIALEPLRAGSELSAPDGPLTPRKDVPAGHKVALRSLASGASVVKYGQPIGVLRANVVRGDWVHSHNLSTGLAPGERFVYRPVRSKETRTLPREGIFQGYRRASGRVGTRNELWVLNTVGCVNRAAERIADACRECFGGHIDDVVAFTHPFGCSQLGDDLDYTRRVLAGLMRHPNAGGVLVLGLGCENNRLESLLEVAAGVDRTRLRFFDAQSVHDEEKAGLAAASELIERMAADRREPCSARDLVIGVKCGGSDGLSGVTANPLVGRMTDRITDVGGTAILTEVPEMFGAERLLMSRAADREVFEAICGLIEGFKNYFVQHHQPIYENPSPGNKDGGLTTLEEKSLGAVQKGGRALITQVLDYGEPVHRSGLALLRAPGNDAVSATALAASGATLILFTSGRGTPLGSPAPVLKISSNSALFERKRHWIDFDAGELLNGGSMRALADKLFEKLLRVASGEATCNELNGYRDIAIWKNGVTL